MSKDPEQYAHQEWLGFVQPVGVVVSPPALLAAQAHVNRNIAPEHQRFLSCLPREKSGEIIPEIQDLKSLFQTVLGWEKGELVQVPAEGALPPDLGTLEVVLPEYRETLRPTHVVREVEPKEGQSPWILLMQWWPKGTALDEQKAAHDRGWVASPQAKFERLLRETAVPIGLLVTQSHLRLVYAPRGETSGYLTFSVSEMAQVAGRPIFSALHMLLCAERLFSLPEQQRLPAILSESRKYQNTVSTQLAEQVLAALYELVRGFQAANDQRKGELLREVTDADPNQVYGGLLAVLMRLVFTIFAEDRGLLPLDPIYANNYSVTGLFQRLRADAGRYPDTMDQRYGAWAQLLTLFRLIYKGGRRGGLHIPARHGYLFDPDRYPFLEGRRKGSSMPEGEGQELPRISDGVVFRVLCKLLLLDGERLSYRTLDVEEIGSVYQTVMGFGVEVATGQSIALNGKRKHKGEVAAPVSINLEILLATKSGERVKWLQEQTDQKFEGTVAEGLKAASSTDDLLAALDRKIARHATPSCVAKGGLLLQPTDERRRSGSHYTPRSFTRPIVEKTLEPILRRLGEHPKPEQLLALKICDIAVGSAAFLVETCRQLAAHLVKAWHYHGQLPVIPPDEDETLFAMRMVAQRCLYGVDRNPMALDLAKLSLWLATLAKDHPFTFLDHALRCGDSLVGLTRKQIEDFTWHEPKEKARLFFSEEVRKRTAAALRERQNLLGLGDDYGTPQLKREKLEKADELLDLVRFIGDAAVAAFFAADKDRAREAKRAELAERIADCLRKGDLKQRPTGEVKALRGGQFPVTPFHWEIEYPEVFDRENPGFDAIVGNPPFVGGRLLRSSLGDEYFNWLTGFFEDASGNADLVAFFFRRAFSLLRDGANFGLIATSTIGQGDTRSTGLRWICQQGGTIYAARRWQRWPGQATVVVSIVWVFKGEFFETRTLDDHPVVHISAYLFHAGGHENPAVLSANEDKSFVGSYILGMGFTFDDSDKSGIASPLASMRDLISKSPSNAERVFPYLGGDELNDDPAHRYHRYVINFADFPRERGDLGETWAEADEKQRSAWLRAGIVPLDYPDPVAADWPDLLEIVNQRVRPERTRKKADASFALRDPLPQRWWHYADKRPALNKALRNLQRCILVSRHTECCGFTFLSPQAVFSDALVVVANEQASVLAVLQSRPHENWARFFGSSIGMTLRYTPSDCFVTFPFPAGFETNAALEKVGQEYYDFRASLMQDVWLGLTETYNLFHSPDDEALARLEALYRKRTADWRTAEAVPADRSPLTLYTTPAAAFAAVQRLRTLHAVMDATVLTAYGWEDLLPKCACEFFLDHKDEEEDEDDSGKGRKKKKPWRYRWPDEVRDEVLARLLKLNAEREKEERVAGLAAEKAAAKVKTGKKTGKGNAVKGQQSLPGM